MIDRVVEILEDEGHPFLLAEFSQPAKRIPSLQPHRAADDMNWLDRKATIVKSGSVQIAARNAKILGNGNR